MTAWEHASSARDRAARLSGPFVSTRGGLVTRAHPDRTGVVAFTERLSPRSRPGRGLSRTPGRPSSEEALFLYPIPMLMRIARVLVLLAVTAGLAHAQPDPAPVPPAAEADVASPDAILAALYDVISGPAGQERDWDRMRSLFFPGARLIPTGRKREGNGNAARVWTVEEYIERAGPQLMENGFWETEIARTTEQFGAVTHAFSTYESRIGTPDSDPTMRGINSIQLFDDGSRWWVVSVFWDSERPDQPIPAAYLPDGR